MCRLTQLVSARTVFSRRTIYTSEQLRSRLHGSVQTLPTDVVHFRNSPLPKVQLHPTDKY